MKELRRLAEAVAGEYDQMKHTAKENMAYAHAFQAFSFAAANPAAILSLLDRLEAAEKDAARLDWLDNYAHIATWVDNEPTKLVIDAASGDEFTGDTWRAAIDAAMEASK